MKLGVKIQLLKFCSHVFDAIILVLGLSIAGCAIWILFSRSGSLSIIPSEALHSVGVGLLVIGVVVLLVALIGCAGSQAENKVLLLTYLSLLVLLVLGQIYVLVLLALNRVQFKDSLDEAVDDIILHYGNGTDSLDRLMDSVQRQGRCCGRTGPDDWLKNSFIQSLDLRDPDVLPCSCFSSARPTSNSSWCSELVNFTDPQIGRGGNITYELGCEEKLSDWLQENVLTIVGMSVGLLVIQVLQFAITLYLYRKFGLRESLRKKGPLILSGDVNLNFDDDDDEWDLVDDLGDGGDGDGGDGDGDGNGGDGDGGD